jgi:hypothetical protein
MSEIVQGELSQWLEMQGKLYTGDPLSKFFPQAF